MTFVFLLSTFTMDRKKHKQNKCKSNIYTSRVENDENIHA